MRLVRPLLTLGAGSGEWGPWRDGPGPFVLRERLSLCPAFPGSLALKTQFLVGSFQRQRDLCAPNPPFPSKVRLGLGQFHMGALGFICVSSPTS